MLIRLIALLLLTCLIVPASGQTEAPRPNIIWIMFDDLGYTDTGAYGETEIPTPNIDRLAVEGTRFLQAYSGAAMCAPARAVLMSGRHTGRTAVRDNFAEDNFVIGLEDGLRGFMLDRTRTVPMVLKAAGYTTCLAGKWGIAEPGTPGVPTKKGFDEFRGILNQRRADNHFPEVIWHNDDPYPLPLNREGQRGQYAADEFTNYALSFIERKQDEPFFLYLAFCIPHDDFNLPDLAPFEDKPWSHQQKAYARMIMDGDAHVGRIMALLDELELADDTLIFLCSDNGSLARYEGVFDSAGEFKGRKYSFHEGGLRVPMIVRWPGKVPAGATSDAIWHFSDFLPTAKALSGSEFPVPGATGINVLPALLGQEQPELEERYLYWEAPNQYGDLNFKYAVRQGRWKGIHKNLEAEMELYDLSTDVGETNNVAAQHPEIVERFKAFMREAHQPSPFHFGPQGR
ncbi:MAG: arylsulfatase [Opitutales bacterium]